MRAESAFHEPDPRISRYRFGGRLPRLRGISPLSCAFDHAMVQGRNAFAKAKEGSP
jgi:hypothetical protein